MERLNMEISFLVSITTHTSVACKKTPTSETRFTEPKDERESIGTISLEADFEVDSH
jgi:hypothetical protein